MPLVPTIEPPTPVVKSVAGKAKVVKARSKTTSKVKYDKAPELDQTERREAILALIAESPGVSVTRKHMAHLFHVGKGTIKNDIAELTKAKRLEYINQYGSEGAMYKVTEKK